MIRVVVSQGGLLGLLLLGACSLVPDYVRPNVASPRNWDGVEAEAVQWPSRDWWKGFRSSTLDILIDTAQRNNTDLAAAAARILQADAQLRIAGASLLPSVDFTGDVSRTLSRTAANGGRRVDQTDSVGVGLRASYEIDLFGANRASVLAADASALLSRFDREAVALSVVSDVANTFFQVLQFRDRLDVARRNLSNAERVLEVVEARVNNGAASQLDLAQQRAQVATQRAALPNLESQGRQAENVLGILLGAGPGDAVGPGSSLLDVVPPPVATGLPSELLIRRPDIQAAEARLIAANAEIGVARAAYFPSLNLSAGNSRSATNLASVLDPASITYSIAASLFQPIFQGGALDAGVDLADARRDELVQSYRLIVLSAFADVENSLVAVRRTGEQEALQQIAVEQALIGFQLAEERYRAGAADLLTVLDAQRTLNSAEDQLVQIRFARLLATVSLFRSLGGGWRLPGLDGPGNP